ncbi:3-deoxy-D-manno-octulosonic acid transferase, partial [Methylobacterium organophilum]|nr:3-deoxy-D-manno-octulosonic acid transferase [Methylobacterium organophilum]
MNRTLYTLLFHLGLPLVFLRLLWRAWRAPAYSRRIGERFAFGLPRLRPGGIWVHAVSVGESIAAAPMVRELMARYPQLPITITCMTPTGSERIQALFGDSVQHCYLPYDLPWAAARFLDRLQPKLAVVMETELWPNHIHQCARRGIPVALANARLSERSARGYARFARLTAPMLAELSLIAVQTEAEAERFRQLGARHECVEVTGSIKFDLAIDPALLARATDLRDQWAAQDRPLWIAASISQLIGILYFAQGAGIAQLRGDFEKVEQMRATEDRLAQRRRLQQVVSAIGYQAATDEGHVGQGIEKQQLAHGVADQQGGKTQSAQARVQPKTGDAAAND